MDRQNIPYGQYVARTRWNTHASGSIFDRKKTSFLTEQAQAFIAERPFCVIAGFGLHHEVCGLLAMAKPGFAYPSDRHTCLLQLDRGTEDSALFQQLQRCFELGRTARVGLLFIRHATRERLCVQGEVELLPASRTSLLRFFARADPAPRLRLHVRQAFFHCPKYVKTCVPGLTVPAVSAFEGSAHLRRQAGFSQRHLSELARAFIARQVLCYLCTADHEGQCAVNHRGGAAGFLVTLLPDKNSPGGTILLPDFAGNGAFEALGNILETGQATIVVPDFAAQLALSISGSARVMEVDALPPEQVRECAGAERVIGLAVQRVTVQHGDWSATLAHERAHVNATMTDKEPVAVCPIK